MVRLMRVYLSGQPAMRRLRVKELARDYFRFHLPVFDVEQQAISTNLSYLPGQVCFRRLRIPNSKISIISEPSG